MGYKIILVNCTNSHQISRALDPVVMQISTKIFPSLQVSADLCICHLQVDRARGQGQTSLQLYSPGQHHPPDDTTPTDEQPLQGNSIVKMVLVCDLIHFVNCFDIVCPVVSDLTTRAYKHQRTALQQQTTHPPDVIIITSVNQEIFNIDLSIC